MDTPAAAHPFIQARDAALESWFFGGRTWIRATARDTGGQLGIIEQICEPGVSSPLHVHHNEDEQFYVIEGQIRFVTEEENWTAGPGTFAFLPRNLPHGFEVVGGTPARFLILVTPGGFESFVAELGDPVPGPPDMEKVMATTPHYGIEILGALPR